ncbi:hypothetical protein NRI_0916 [Neorickettsia risticii str. Illinois]|uniref:Uncharacterized protein n=1 Tax=Neorickettsia risticii (strain Illinois) TaxID=434131 RepID=C6V664_NEORI|nr:hypothetical protein [Neorickettsia risticii]ACT69879.1 hypothetical protein NRI_0916 [Neorickettsia risticii str. Illinois]
MEVSSETNKDGNMDISIPVICGHLALFWTIPPVKHLGEKYVISQILQDGVTINIGRINLSFPSE